MAKMKTTKASSNVKKETNPFYINEILRDYQEHKKNMLKQMKIIPDDKPNHVGMEKVNAKSCLGKYFVEYASSSTLHGFNHLAAPRRHPLEKLLVVVFILVALGALIALSFIFWDRYQHSAIVINLDKNRDYFTVNKPAYLLCALRAIDKSKFPTVFQRYSVTDTQEARKFFVFLSNVKYEEMRDTPNFDEVDPNLWLRILYDLRTDFPSSVLQAPDIDETWVVTERGICFAVRGYTSIYANPEYWFADNWTFVPPPETIPYFDHSNSIGLTETINMNMEIAVAPYDPGDIITYQTPMRTIYGQLLDHINLIMNDITTMEQVKELNVYQRKCKYPDDKGLKMWPIYTYGMCVRECRMNLIKDHCNCYPHFSRTVDKVPVCNAKQLRCIGEIQNKLFLHKKAPAFCRCPPNCNSITYIVQQNIRTELNSDTLMNVSIFRSNIEFPLIKFNRAVLFGFIDFLTAVGGAAGLFIGASVLSFVEIIFYATLHLCVYATRVHKQRQKARSKLTR